jgi:hypothetical protein
VTIPSKHLARGMATLSASDPQTQEVERDGSSLLRDKPFPNGQQGATTGGSTTTLTATATTPKGWPLSLPPLPLVLLGLRTDQ